MSKTVEMLKNYNATIEQEKRDIEFIINCENKMGQILTRENMFAHLCATAFVVNKTHDKVLCVYHNIFDAWALPGGHADGDDDMLYVAKKELEEETGVSETKLLIDGPVSVDTLGIASHNRRGVFVPAHIHLHVAYLFEADENLPTRIKEDENSAVKWIDIDEFISFSKEFFMVKIFKKIIQRLNNLS